MTDATTNNMRETIALPMTDDGHPMHPSEPLFVIDREKPRRKAIRDTITGLLWLGEPAGWMVKLERCDILSVPSQRAILLHEAPTDRAIG